MGYINHVINKKLCEMFKKKKFTQKTIWELKTAFFIHFRTYDSDNEIYAINYSPYDDSDVFEIYT